MDLSNLFEAKSIAPDDDEEKIKDPKYIDKPEEKPEPNIPPQSVQKHKKKNIGVELFDKGQRAFELEEAEPEEKPIQITEPTYEPESVNDVVDDAQNAPEEELTKTDKWEEPELQIDIEEEPGTWYYEFELKVLSAETLKDYIDLLKEKNKKIRDLYVEEHQDIDDEILNNKLRQLKNIRLNKEQQIESLYSSLDKARIERSRILSREGPYAVSREEEEEQSVRDAKAALGASLPGTSGYEERIERALSVIDQKILESKKELYVLLIKYPGATSGFSPSSLIEKEKSETERRDPTKNKVVVNLNNIMAKAIKASGQMFVDNQEEQEQYINELEQDHYNYSNKIIELVEQAMKAERASRSAENEEESRAQHKLWMELSTQANKLLGEFKEKYDPESQEKPLEDSEFRDQRWYSDKFREYMLAATTLPGAPPSIGDSLKNLANRSKFISSSAKYPDINQVISDRSLIDQVMRGVKPIAHTKTFRREIKLTREESQQIAYVLAPEQMGGGVIWYRPAQRAGERPYDERILGLDPEADKEDRPSTKPYNPMSKDANLNIVELYMWNNIANNSDPKLYNFINGLCLGYPRDYVIWFCESKYGYTDNRQPEKTFWGRMLDRFRYCVNAGVNGYGRPGSIKPDGMFSKIFKLLTPDFINDWVNRILGTSSEINPHEPFASVMDEFEPTRAPDKTEFEDEDMFEDKNKHDPIIESIYGKLDNL